MLLELQAVAAAVESSGQAKAEAQAQAERLLIEGQSAIECECLTRHCGSVVSHVTMLIIYKWLCSPDPQLHTTLCTPLLLMASENHSDYELL